MDRCRLKNIIIFILVLVNGFLLVSLAQRRAAQQDAFRRTAEQLVDLYAADGMALYPHAISRDTPPGGVVLTRDGALEERAASFLLGENLSSTDQGGGIHHYTGAAGEAFFRSSSGFEASGVLAQSGAEDFCRDFCRTFSYDAPNIRLDGEGNGVFTAAAVHARLPVFNCTVTFTAAQDRRALRRRGDAALRRRGPDGLPADAAGKRGGGLQRDGHPPVL